MANFGDYSGDFGRFFIYLFCFLFLFWRFQPLIWRPGDTVQIWSLPNYPGELTALPNIEFVYRVLTPTK